MPVKTRSQTANNATPAPAPKPAPKAKPVYVRTLPKQTEEQKRADEKKEYDSEDDDSEDDESEDDDSDDDDSKARYLKRRANIIEENNYANSEVFAVLREARQTLGESKFVSLVFLLEALCFTSNYIVDVREYDEKEGLLLLPWFRRLFDLLASGKTTFELKYLDEDEDEYDYYYHSKYPKRVQFHATWEHMDDMIRLHYSELFPIWYQCSFSKITF